MTELVCATCAKPFRRRTADFKKATKRGFLNAYCSRSCAGSPKRTREQVEAVCQQCGGQFERALNPTRNRPMFCSTRCVALHHNAAKAGTSKLRCGRCGAATRVAVDRCQGCLSADLADLTLGEIREDSGIVGSRSRIRGHARTAYRGPGSCQACGYDLHFDVCHIRAVADFPLSAKLGEVNAATNLVALDKRCHWEFDHGYLHRVIELDGSVSWLRTETATARPDGPS